MNTSLQTEHKTICNVELGRDVLIFDFTNLYGCSIGDESRIGAFVEIQKGATIGKRCKISSHSFICEGVHIEDCVFVGHNVTFINDRYPRAVNSDGSLKTSADWVCTPTLIKHNASIGSSATIMSGITVGEYAIVGAGSVVTKDVPAGTIVAGNPAVILRRIDDCSVAAPCAAHAAAAGSLTTQQGAAI